MIAWKKITLLPFLCFNLQTVVLAGAAEDIAMEADNACMVMVILSPLKNDLD